MRRLFSSTITLFMVAVLWETLSFPPDVYSRELSLTESTTLNQDSDTAVAKEDTGYVDMQSDEAGDRFVDEDGDGIDDRHLRKHQKRNRQGWRDSDWRENGSEDGAKGSGGQQGYGNGPGRGGRW